MKVSAINSFPWDLSVNCWQKKLLTTNCSTITESSQMTNVRSQLSSTSAWHQPQLTTEARYWVLRLDADISFQRNHHIDIVCICNFCPKIMPNSIYNGRINRVHKTKYYKLIFYFTNIAMHCTKIVFLRRFIA